MTVPAPAGGAADAPSLMALVPKTRSRTSAGFLMVMPLRISRREFRTQGGVWEPTSCTRLPLTVREGTGQQPV